MKRIYLRWSAMALAAAMILPLAAQTTSQTHRRVNANSGVPTATAQKKINEANREKFEQINKIFERNRAGAPGIGSGGPRTFDVKPQPKQAANYLATRSAYEPRGKAYAVVPSHSLSAGYNNALFGSVDFATGKFTQLYRGSEYSLREDYQEMTSFINDGIIYIPAFVQDMVTLDMSVFWRRIDLATGQRLSDISFGDDFGGFAYALTYNPDNGKYYGFAINLVTGTYGEFYEYDISGHTPTATYLGSLYNSQSGMPCSICYNPKDQMLYTVKDNGTMYMFEGTTNPTLMEVAQFANGGGTDDLLAVPDKGYATTLCYSPKDEAFVTIYRDAASQLMRLVFIDANDYTVYSGNTLSMTGWYSSLNCIEAYADNDAPAQAELKEVILDKASLNGKISYVAPKEDFAGNAISGQTMKMYSYIDGNQIDVRTVTPGESYTVDFATTQGNHTFSIRPVFEVGTEMKEGPESKIVKWVGNDNPKAPANLKFKDLTVTWDAVTEGYHLGYVDAEAVTYDIMLDGEKVNTAPLTETTYTFDLPESLLRRNITVTATANDMTSEKSTPLSVVFGKALELPQSFAPTKQEASLFNVDDANHDGTVWQFYEKNSSLPDRMGIGMVNYTESPDDWMFLPLMHFDSADHLYQLAFTYCNFYNSNERMKSNIKVYIGNGASAANMTTLIYERDGDNVLVPINIEALFGVPEAGDYYIGIYTGFVQTNNSRGAAVWDIHVSSLDDVSADLPGAAEDVTISAAPNGELAAIIDATIPTHAIDGSVLPETTGDITLTGSYEDNSASATGKPGEKVSIKVPINANGFAYVDLQTSYNGVNTIKRNYRTFVGIDVPMKPANVKGVPSVDNMTLALTWDHVEKGVNGGYVNPATRKYDIYVMHGSNSQTKVAETKLNEYIYNPNDAKQRAYYVGPACVTEEGSSTLNDFIYEYLGTPYDLPMNENFQQTSSTGFSTGPWTNGNGIECPWSHTQSVEGLGYGNAIPDGAIFICSSLGGLTGKLNAPKVCTTAVYDARIGLRYWNYPNAANIEVWGRRHGHLEDELLFTINPNRPANVMLADWVDWSEQLPEEYQNCPWIQIYPVAKLLNSTSTAILDKYDVYQDVEHDFRVKEVTGPSSAFVGEKPTFSITASNSGLEAGASNLVIRLKDKNGKVLSREDVRLRRLLPAHNYTHEISFEMKPEYLESGELTVVGTIEDEDDEIERNNEISMTVTLRNTDLPVARNVEGKWNDSHNTVSLTWDDAESTEYGSHESFEYDTPFQITEQLGQWTNVDMDKKAPFAIEGARFDNDNMPSAWTVINAETLSTMDVDRLCPHHGKQYIMARSCDYDMNAGEEPAQSADWLISPEVVGGSTVSFWYNTIDSQYTETVEIWYSTTDTTLGDEIVQNGTEWTCGSWKRLRPFTKSGSETWEHCTATLPENAKYFALVYRSWGQFGALLDEIEFTPAKAQNWDIDGYVIFRELRDEKVYEEAGTSKTRSFLDETVGDKNVSYFINTRVRRADGNTFLAPRSSELRLFSLGLNDVDALTSVTGGKGEILVSGLEGNDIDIYGADGKMLRRTTISDAKQSIKIDGGIYVVKCGNKIAKVVVR